MVDTQNTNAAEGSSTESVRVTTARVEQKAKEMVDVVMDASVKWAGLGLGVGRKTLTTSARALDRAADKLAVLEDKLKKTPEAAAPSATEATGEASAPDTKSN